LNISESANDKSVSLQNLRQFVPYSLHTILDQKEEFYLRTQAFEKLVKDIKENKNASPEYTNLIIPMLTDAMETLVSDLNDLAYRYYVLDEPIVSDKEYDFLYDFLLYLEQEVGKPLKHSPTQRIGGEPLANFQQHRHIAPLWSMDKVRTDEDLRAWAARATKLAAEYSANTGEALPPLQFTVE
jgi:hypothetical protein